jgi:kinesin family member 12
MDQGNVPSQMNSFYGDSMLSNVGGERVKVALRVRPMMSHEQSRGDDSIVSVADNQHAMLSLKTGTKSFRFNAVLDETTKQSDVFNCCGVHVRRMIF